MRISPSETTSNLQTIAAEFLDSALIAPRLEALRTFELVSLGTIDWLRESIDGGTGEGSAVRAHQIEVLERDHRAEKAQLVGRLFPLINHLTRPLEERLALVSKVLNQELSRQEALLFLCFGEFLRSPYFRGLDALISGYEPELVRGKSLSHEYLFALFLWTRLAYDKREGLGLAALERYGFDFASEDTPESSTVDDRIEFLGLFRDYIHYDVLSATEYQSEGSLDVLRLNLRLRFPGYAWLTHCAERSNDCNTGFPVTPSKVRELRTYTPHLEPARASHQCYTCGKYLAIYVNFTCSRACAK